MLGRSWVGSGSADASEIEISLHENVTLRRRNADLEVQTARKRWLSIYTCLPMDTPRLCQSAMALSHVRVPAGRPAGAPPHRVLTLRFVRFEECTDSRSSKQPGLAGEKRHVGIGFAIFSF